MPRWNRQDGTTAPAARGARPGLGRRAYVMTRELGIMVVAALAVALLVKTFVVQAFSIPSESMEDTLLPGDRIAVSRFPLWRNEFHRGDIIVFQDPGGWLPPSAPVREDGMVGVVRSALAFAGVIPTGARGDLVKRVIGLPGDLVVCCDPSGHLTVNGAGVAEPYLKPGDAASTARFHITVPPGRVWVMGDHRSVSGDSRYHDAPARDGTQGSVDERLIVGRATALIWPLSRATGL